MDIEQRALVDDLRELRGFLDGSGVLAEKPFGSTERDDNGFKLAFWWRRHLDRIDRAVEAIEAHDAYRQEVSDKVSIVAKLHPTAACYVSDLIIQPKPDPLVEAIETAMKQSGVEDPVRSETVKMAEQLRAALKSRGLEIREVGE